MLTKKERILVLQMILRRGGFPEHSFVPKSAGFAIAGSCNPDDLRFLGILNDKVIPNVLKEGLVVCASYSDDISQTKIVEYANALDDEGIASQILDVTLDSVFNRGAYLFVPH